MVLKKILFVFILLFSSSILAEDKKSTILIKKEKNKINIEKSFHIGFYSFQASTKIKTPTTDYSQLQYSTGGILLGYSEAGDIRWFRIRSSFDAFLGNTDGKADSNDLDYFKKQLTTYGGIASVSFLIPLDSEKKAFVGPELSGSYLKTNWYVPSQSNGSWTIDKTDKFIGTISLAGEYHYNNFLIYHKIGQSLGRSSFVWNLGIAFKLPH